jgi:hypothetical protein
MPDPNTMTLDEIRDWLTQKAGWTHRKAQDLWFAKDDPIGMFTCRSHPIPPTLDAAAAAMPEGWTWLREYRPHPADNERGCVVCWVAFHDVLGEVVMPDTGNEITARYRLAMICILAEESTNAK